MKYLLIIINLLLLVGCSKNVETIPLVIYDYEDLYMQDFRTLIVDNISGDYQFASYDSKNSQVIQNEIIESVLNNTYPLLVVNPVDRLGVYPIIEKAKSVNTPIIFINREPLKEDLDLWEHVYYVGAKAEQSASIQAEIVTELFGGNPSNLNQYDLNQDNKIQAIILKGEPGHQDAEIRTEAVVEYIEDLGFTLDVLTIQEAYFSQTIAEEEMQNVIDDFGTQFEVIISNNDAMAIGAINTLKENDYFVDTNENGIINRETEPWIPVIGIDGLPPAINLIEQGYLYGTVINDSAAMAQAINELTYSIINNLPLTDLTYPLIDETYIWIDYKKYTPE
ncbi:MAG: galactose ABC transporter substrate-binding protein [Candidatus Izimaplasma sp.]|nr:galactose ABC transporter substrate-binding protein [Candidatus Izimaplasma bacterium]